MKSNELSKSFEKKVGQTIFVVEAKNLDKGKVSAEEKLKNIMIRDLLANDNAMASLKIAEKVDFQGLGASNEVSKKSSKMA
jgi:hypothetical protein